MVALYISNDAYPSKENGREIIHLMKKELLHPNRNIPGKREREIKNGNTREELRLIALLETENSIERQRLLINLRPRTRGSGAIRLIV